jgi:hypothetical protein
MLQGSRAILGSFLEHTASMTPRSAKALMLLWKSWYASPSGPLPSRIPVRPSSPMTPPQRVLSRSRTRHRRESPVRAASTAAQCRARVGRAREERAILAQYQLRSSNHAALPNCAAMASVSTNAMSRDLASLARAKFRSRSNRERLPAIPPPR